MNEDTLVVVHCYVGDVEQVEFMLPKFLHHDCRVLVLSPEDAPVEISHPRVTNRSAGKAGWKGLHTIERQMAHLEIIREFPERFLLLNDSDSVCLYGEIPSYLYEAPDVFWSNEGCDSSARQEAGTWSVQDEYNQTLQPPYFLTQEMLARILDVGQEALSKAHAESGIDQWYAECVRTAGIQRKVYPDGIHRETRRLNELARVYYMARTYGTCMIHSVKTAEALETLAVGLWEHDNGPEWGPGR